MSPKWRSLYDSVNYGDELNQEDGFDKAKFFFINTEVSAQYRQCVSSCFNKYKNILGIKQWSKIFLFPYEIEHNTAFLKLQLL